MRSRLGFAPGLVLAVLFDRATFGLMVGRGVESEQPMEHIIDIEQD